MLLLDITVVNVALPVIREDLGASFSDLQWVVDAYALTLAALLLVSGSFADLVGRRRVFILGLILFSAASFACGLAQSPLWLIVSRGVQGIGGAMLFATSLALIAGAFTGRDRATAFGIWARRSAPPWRSDRWWAAHSPTASAGSGSSSSTCRSGSRRCSSRSRRSTSRKTRTPPASTGPVRSPSRPACSCSCWRSSAATRRAGAAP